MVIKSLRDFIQRRFAASRARGLGGFMEKGILELRNSGMLELRNTEFQNPQFGIPEFQNTRIG
jgi:hypothetical protein